MKDRIAPRQKAKGLIPDNVVDATVGHLEAAINTKSSTSPLFLPSTQHYGRPLRDSLAGLNGASRQAAGSLLASEAIADDAGDAGDAGDSGDAGDAGAIEAREAVTKRAAMVLC
ncbi:hypothetical protein MY10362_006498 [Beauveria mimosiformis]